MGRTRLDRFCFITKMNCIQFYCRSFESFIKPFHVFFCVLIFLSILMNFKPDFKILILLHHISLSCPIPIRDWWESIRIEYWSKVAIWLMIWFLRVSLKIVWMNRRQIWIFWVNFWWQGWLWESELGVTFEGDNGLIYVEELRMMEIHEVNNFLKEHSCVSSSYYRMPSLSFNWKLIRVLYGL